MKPQSSLARRFLKQGLLGLPLPLGRQGARVFHRLKARAKHMELRKRVVVDKADPSPRDAPQGKPQPKRPRPGSRGNNAPPPRKLKVYISGQKRRVTEVIKHACGDARRQRERRSPAGPLPPPLPRKRPRSRTRPALTGLRKRGYAVVRERVGSGDSVYRMSGAAADGGDA